MNDDHIAVRLAFSISLAVMVISILTMAGLEPAWEARGPWILLTLLSIANGILAILVFDKLDS